MAVAETFYSIQGEGQTMGRPAYFLRLSGCNLMCGGRGTEKDGALHDGAKWRCDTIEVWRKGKSVSFNAIIERFGGDAFIDRLRAGTHLIITGGEPLIQQTKITNFLQQIVDEYGFTPTVEIETNGTLMPSMELCRLVTYWNVSPKLSNSGMAHSLRFHGKEIAFFNAIPGDGVIFKFVVTLPSDWTEIHETYWNFVNHKKIWLMPGTDHIGSFRTMSALVIEICKRYNVNYSSRLHIAIWDKKTGV